MEKANAFLYVAMKMIGRRSLGLNSINKSSQMSKLAWKEINWILVQDRLSRQQRRVYKAKIEGKGQTVHAIQRRIIRSLDAKLLAVKHVTTENQGPNLSYIRNMKELSDEKKIELAYGILLDGKSKAYLYGIGTKKKEFCPLHMPYIPMIEDSAKQMLAKFALEPEWEAVFEPNSYGYRPGRSYHDAISFLRILLRGKSRFVLEANIHNCFDEIDHDKLVAKLDTFNQMENQIKVWLKMNIMVGFENESNEVNKILEGKFQKAIISPLLVNIALHGLEKYIKNYYRIANYTSFKQKKYVDKAIGFSRYVNDFVITAPTFEDITEIRKVVDKWLIQEMGLKLSKKKTRIVNSTSGFKFLGFQIISIKTGQNAAYKTKVGPSKESKCQIIQYTRKIIQQNKSVSSYVLITLLSPKIIGWANYFQFPGCQKDFSKIDYIIFKQIRAWVFRRKSKGLRSRDKLKEKYFPNGNTFLFNGNKHQNNWILTGETLDKTKKSIKQNFLPKMSWINSIQHIKVKDNASPYDKNYWYWSKRAIKHSSFSNELNNLIQVQNGCCGMCGIPFSPMDIIEFDYIVFQAKGQSERFSSLQAIHKHCQIENSLINQAVLINDSFNIT